MSFPDHRQPFGGVGFDVGCKLLPRCEIVPPDRGSFAAHDLRDLLPRSLLKITQDVGETFLI